MLISYHWLKQFIPNLKASPKQVADKITLSLVEVESVTKRGDDTILDIENKGITNRPDCFSQLGIAREVVAYFDLKLKNPLQELTKRGLGTHQNSTLRVEVRAKKLCRRYNAIILTNVKVGPSPKWLRVGLENVGVRSINNVVDITNYVMFELGQPLHAFDYEKVAGQKIVVRKAKNKEKIVTLDGVERELTNQVLVIADQEKPIGIAGIMGGANTEVTSQTKTVVLESANFEPINNRRSSKSLKLRTEASTRFEKDLDDNLTYPALIRAIELLQEHAGAKVASKIFDIKSKPLNKPKTVTINTVWINKFLGLELSAKEMTTILNRLNLQTKQANNSLKVTIPPFRKDLNMEADIAEEIARIYGYDKIPITLPVAEMRVGKSDPHIIWRRKIKQALASFGMTEIHTYSLVGDELLEKAGFDPKSHLKLKNPLTEDRKHLRRSLIPSMLEAVVKNRKTKNLKLFEIARTFLEEKDHIEEIEILLAVATGKNCFYKLKGIFEVLFEILGIKETKLKPLERVHGPWSPDQVAEIFIKKEFAGILGNIHSQILENFGVNKEVVILNLNLEALIKNATAIKTYTPQSKYPSIIEDLAFVVPERTYVGPIMQLIREQSPLIQSVTLLDSFDQTRTFKVIYQHSEKNLTDEEVQKIRVKIIAKIKTEFNAHLKS